MPGIDGFKVCRDIKNREEDTQRRIIAVTGYPDENIFKRARDAGADECLSKPLDVTTLIDLIRSQFQTPLPRRTRGRRARRTAG